MTEHSGSLAQTWQNVINDLLALSEQPSSGIGPISARQRGFLSLVTPVALVPGYAVLAAPHAMAKSVIEQDLGTALTSVLSAHMGRPTGLAVSVNPEAVMPEAAADAHLEQPQDHTEHPATSAQHESSGMPTSPSSELLGGDNAAVVPPPSTPQQLPGTTSTESESSAPQQWKEQGWKDKNSQDKSWQESHATYSEQPHYSEQPYSERPHPQQQHPQQQHHGQRPQPGHSPAQHRDSLPQHGHDASVGFGHPASNQQAAAPQRYTREQPAPKASSEGSLNPKYTFDSFVIGSSNRFAHAAAVAVAETPAKAFNPLFIWGGSGLGKTHLLHAAGLYSQVLQPGLRVKYVSSEEFTNDYINSVRDDRQEAFKRRYRNLDILMVDDIQFLEGKEGTQEEFFHTFNALHQADKQIILSSDRPPKELTTLEDRLRTRFAAGLITDIQPPDLETRIAILMKKAQDDGTQVPRDVLELIASRFESSIRELEGALIRVAAFSSLTNQPITIDHAEVALRDIMPENKHVEITSHTIITATANYFDISVDAITGTSKTHAVVHARQLAMYLCRELTALSLPKIGEKFGGKNHTTVMYAERKIKDEMQENRDTYDQIQELTQLIKNGSA
ncbi:Chromosomal replication initiator protein DnaA [Corynebacterium ciconiae DSM 44920]|uniref:chromosomal replication initiator protein DnaA n=1 Tax=Corynebacterium ciconiae TaxID=227319 RepID=UPI000373BEA7|nr:chromosomal replication initiator protein DnaA [Corynebacterium ciconiae]WKD60067.1 Chromosomal replication initiator protein DnaA [Corynebacterium ciconiae DSM 44920]